MKRSQPGYRSFMLRIWCEETENDINDSNWRASLQDVVTGERRGFANLQSLCRYLLELAGQPGSVNGECPNDPTVF